MAATPDSPSEDDSYTRYLLGLLSAEETERLDELTLVDTQAAARLQAVENDLIDTYVTGMLPVAQQERFEKVYFATARGRDKVRFAQSLGQATASASYPQDTSAATSESRTGAGPDPASQPTTSAPSATATSPPGQSTARGVTWYAKVTARLRGGWGLAAMVIAPLPLLMLGRL